MTTNRHFFAQKQPWSTIKDQLLAAYLAPYLAKLSQQGGRILVADCFAGRGSFDDGSQGSPLLIADAICNQFGNIMNLVGVSLGKVADRSQPDFASRVDGIGAV